MDDSKFYDELAKTAKVDVAYMMGTDRGLDRNESLMALLISTLLDFHTTLYEMAEDVNAVGCALEAIKKEYCGE